MSAGKSALIVGATGATGRHILRALLASTVFTRVGEFGRKVTPEDQIAEHKASGKLVQKVIDFERVAEEGLGEGKWDVVFITYVSDASCFALRLCVAESGGRFNVRIPQARHDTQGSWQRRDV